MGSYNTNEPSSDAAEGGGAGQATNTNNPDRAVQAGLSEVMEEEEDMVEDLPEDTQEQLAAVGEHIESQQADEDSDFEDIPVREGVENESAVEIGAAAAESWQDGLMSDAGLERLDMSPAEEDSNVDSDVAVRTNQNGTIMAGATHHLSTDENGEINAGQARRMMAREELVANGFARVNTTATDEYREQVQATGSDGFNEGITMGTADEKKIEKVNDNLAQENAEEMAESLNEAMETMHDEEASMAGGRTDAGRQTTDAENLYAMMRDEYTTASRDTGHDDGFNGGTNDWQHHGETLKTFAETTDYDLNEQTKEYINVMNQAGAESDDIPQHWDTDGKVFDDAGADHERVIGNMYGNTSDAAPGGNAGTSPHVVSQIRETFEGE